MNLALRRHLAQKFYPCDARTFSAEYEQLSRHDPFRVFGRLQRRQMRRYDLKDVNIFTREVFSEQRLVFHPLLGDDMQATSARQRRENDCVAKIGRDG